MQKMIIIYLIFQIFLVGSCTSDNSKLSGNEESIIDNNRDKFVELLEKNGEKPFWLIPRDTNIEFDNGIRLILYKNSFLTKDGELYLGKVQVRYLFEDPRDMYLRDKYTYQKPEINSSRGIIIFTATDSTGRELSFNDSPPILVTFPNSLAFQNLIGFYYDSNSNMYKNQLIELRKTQMLDTSGLILHPEDYTPEEYNRIVREYYDGKIEKTEIIGYQMAIKYSGIYFIESAIKPSLKSNVTVSAEVLNADISHEHLAEIKIFLISDIEKIYLRADWDSAGIYKFKMNFGDEIQIPIKDKYLLFAYLVTDESSYYYISDGMRLNSNNHFNILLKEAEVEEIVAAMFK